MNPRWGLLLVNLGTPAGPEPAPLARYLREFLSDPRVVDVSPLLRAFLVNVIIVPRRAKAKALDYQKIWTEGGSPLLVHGRELARKVAARLDGEVPVELAMRYQEPSIAGALDRLHAAGADRIAALPLFPQNSAAAWSSAVEKIYREAGKRWDVPGVQIIPPFYDHPSFLQAVADNARPVIQRVQPERILMSFHGVPERHLRKSDPSGGQHCLSSPSCCESIGPVNRNCYRAQCIATARGVAGELGLEPSEYEVTFQSRFGKDPWIQPFTDIRVRQLATEGVRRLVVLSPAFVADCLETLEELQITARDDYLRHGGETLELVPSLNAGDAWADAVLAVVRDGLRFPG